MNFEVKMSENVRNNIFRDKQKTHKVPLMSLDVKLLTKKK